MKSHFLFKCITSISAFSFFLSFSHLLLAQGGALDSSFDSDGKLTTNFIGERDDIARTVVVQADGKIVVAGHSAEYFNTHVFTLVRYNTDGSFDTSFGQGGKVLTEFNASYPYYFHSEATSLAIQTDGKLVAGGTVFSIPADFALARYNSDGSLDSTFGGDGMVTTFVDNGAYLNSLAIQPDGKIVVAGNTGSEPSMEFVLVRYNDYGTLDSSFSTDGIVITDISSSNDGANAVAIQPDGKIIAAGYSKLDGYDCFALVRYNSDGVLDSSFNNTGIITTSFGPQTAQAHSVVLQVSGKIVAIGGVNVVLALTQYNTDGILDSTFGTGGKVITDDVYLGYAGIIQTDGKIIAAGSGYENFALVRYNMNGNPDNSFGTNGIVTTVVIGEGGEEVNDLAIAPDGKIVAAGFAENGIDYYPEDFAVVRYLTDLSVGLIVLSSSPSSPLIYPNPVQERERFTYTLTVDEVLTLGLYDMNGRLIKTFYSSELRQAGLNTEILDLGNLAGGNYFITLSNNSHRVSVKILKQ